LDPYEEDEEVWQMLLHKSSIAGEKEPGISTQAHGENGLCGVISGTAIPFYHLKK